MPCAGAWGGAHGLGCPVQRRARLRDAGAVTGSLPGLPGEIILLLPLVLQLQPLRVKVVEGNRLQRGKVAARCDVWVPLQFPHRAGQLQLVQRARVQLLGGRLRLAVLKAAQVDMLLAVPVGENGLGTIQRLCRQSAVIRGQAR